MKRFALMQAWPLLAVREATAVATALSRSALGITMNGSEPPSSSTTCFTSEPAMDARDRPAGSDPVRVVATTRRSRSTPSTRDAGISSDRKAPSGKPARSNSVSRYNAACGTLEACLSSAVLPAISAGAANRITCQMG